MNTRLPKVGDIWQDHHGPFLVLEEHDLPPIDARNGYVCVLTVLGLNNGIISDHWTLGNATVRELVFIA